MLTIPSDVIPVFQDYPHGIRWPKTHKGNNIITIAAVPSTGMLPLPFIKVGQQIREPQPKRLGLLSNRLRDPNSIKVARLEQSYCAGRLRSL